ncbi:MAG TPA: hypothetical protein V6C88_10140 [Chroococcidiopsis sp.]
MTFLVDANVLIDLGLVQGLDILPKLDESEVLDIVLLECEEPTGLAEQIITAGIREVESQIEWSVKAQTFKIGRLSVQDVLNFYYAKNFHRTLLTNEKPLRNLCEREGVKFHGLLWIVEQAHQLQLEPPERLCNWLLTLEQIGSRFPARELANLRQLLQC